MNKVLLALKKVVKFPINAYRKIYDDVSYAGVRKVVPNDLTIISRDCLGGILYSRLKMRFNSPTVNLYLSNSDFIKLCKNLRGFFESELVEIEDSPKGFPRGGLEFDGESVVINFRHYGSFAEAKECWIRRLKRVNYDKIYVILNAEAEALEEDIAGFDDIPYKKILLSSGLKRVNGERVNLKSYENGFRGSLVFFKHKLSAVRVMDEYDWRSALKNISKEF